MTTAKVHYQHSASTSPFARMFCGLAPHRTGLRGGITSPNKSAVTCTRCLAKLAAPKAARAPRTDSDTIEYTAEDQARVDALPLVPRR